MEGREEKETEKEKDKEKEKAKEKEKEKDKRGTARQGKARQGTCDTHLQGG